MVKRLNEPMVKFEDVWFEYWRGPTALRGIDLSISPGEFVALVGQNGAGKTTLMKHLNGLLKPTKGDVIVDGMNTKAVSIGNLAKTVGYVFQNPDHQIFASSVEEEVSFGPRNIKLGREEVKNRVDEALKAVGLEGMRDRHPFTLSRGQRQKLAVASVLAMQPKILLLDEPTTGQDEMAINQVMLLVDELRKKDTTIIMATHDMSIVTKHAERTIVLCEGRVLLDGPTNEVFLRPEILSRASLQPPPITGLVRMLSGYGVQQNIFTVEELCGQILEVLGR